MAQFDIVYSFVFRLHVISEMLLFQRFILPSRYNIIWSGGRNADDSVRGAHGIDHNYEG